MITHPARAFSSSPLLPIHRNLPLPQSLSVFSLEESLPYAGGIHREEGVEEMKEEAAFSDLESLLSGSPATLTIQERRINLVYLQGALTNYQSLYRLSIRESHITSDVLATVFRENRYLPQLTELVLNGVQGVSFVDCQAFSKLISLESLTVELMPPENAKIGTILKSIRRPQQLRLLHLAYHPAYDIKGAEINLRSFCNVRQLFLIHARSLEVEALAHLIQLQLLDITECTLKGKGGWVVFGNFPELKELFITRCAISEADLEILRSCSMLERLVINGENRLIPRQSQGAGTNLP